MPRPILPEVMKARAGVPISDLLALLWAKKLQGYSITTITGVPPLSFRADGTPLISLSMLGNGQQTGTPTPDNPIMPTFCGVRTGNLADLYNTNARQVGLTFSATDGMRIVINGTKINGSNIVPIKRPNIILPAGTYTVKIKMVSGEITGLTSDGIMFGINASTYAQRTTVVTKVGEIGKRIFTLSEETTVSSFDITPSYGSIGAVFDNATFECWLYSGSDDIPYEPYGWAEKITSAEQTQAVYLGQTQTLRRIKKLVLTGQETSWYASSGFMYNDTIQPDYLRSAAITIICSHYKAIGGVGAGSEVSNGQCALYRFALVQRLYIRDDNYTSVDDFKAYLAAQYAAGTPLTVWYVLAAPETAIINKPLAKIGTYADELHSEDACITIPTVRGSNVLTVETDLQPSSVTITGHIKQM